MEKERQVQANCSGDNRTPTVCENRQQEPARCPVCGELTEEYFPQTPLFKLPALAGLKHHRQCACERAEAEAEQRARQQRKHEQIVQRLQEKCFGDNLPMRNMTFETSGLENAATAACKNYAADWESVRADNTGLLLWGDVGTGKTYMAACIANALMQQEISVVMLNMGDVMNASFDSLEEIMRRIRQCELLIIDDYGMERETDYGRERTFQVIDTRCRDCKPFIITTNLSLYTLKAPKDESCARIYDRILGNCIPVQFRGQSLRVTQGKRKQERFRERMNGVKGDAE